MSTQAVQDLRQKLKDNIQQVIIGKDEIIDQLIIGLLCEGHVLLEDVPGMGKTVLAKALSKSLSADFARIQFTPDLMPSDLTGINYFNQKEGAFRFRKGPLMNQIILADEINRATPRTQSSLLEAMAEHQITVDGETHALEAPFFVIATQNPVETKGTFPLPEAQLDRFFMQLKMGYPTVQEEMDILKRFKKKDPLTDLVGVVSPRDLKEAQACVQDVRITDEVMAYLIALTQATRKHPDVELGISPRGTMALFSAARAQAAMLGRDYVLPDDIKEVAPAVLAHRMILSANALITGSAGREIIDQILVETDAPVEPVQVMA